MAQQVQPGHGCSARGSPFRRWHFTEHPRTVLERASRLRPLLAGEPAVTLTKLRHAWWDGIAAGWCQPVSTLPVADVVADVVDVDSYAGHLDGHHLFRYGTDKLQRLVKEVVDRRRSTGMLGNDLMHGHVVGRATGRDQSNATTLLLLLIAKHPCRIIGLVLCRESRRHRRSGKQDTRHEACGVVRVGQDASPVVVLLNLILDGRHRTLAKILSHHWLHNLSGNKQSFLQGTPGPQQLPTERRILTRPSGQPWGQLLELPSLQGISARYPPL